MAYNSECVYRHNKKLVLKFFKKCSALYVSSSVAQSCPTLCNPMDGSMPDFPVHQQLPEPTQMHHVGYMSPTKYICESWAGIKIIAF